MEDLIHHYSASHEGQRLFSSRAKNMEFRSTVRLVEARLAPSSRILETGAGEGVYSLYFAAQGHRLTALDIVPDHVEAIRQKAGEEGIENMEVLSGDARDLSVFPDGSFDAVLCLGPLYHLRSRDERLACIREAMRVLAPGGFIALAFINLGFALAYLMKAGIILNDRDYQDFLKPDWVRKDHPDVFLNIGHFAIPEEAEAEVQSCGLEILEHAAVDGLYGLIQDRLEDLDEGSMNALLEYHQKTMLLKSSLGASNHTLIIARKVREENA